MLLYKACYNISINTKFKSKIKKIKSELKKKKRHLFKTEMFLKNNLFSPQNLLLKNFRSDTDSAQKWNAEVSEFPAKWKCKMKTSSFTHGHAWFTYLSSKAPTTCKSDAG